MGDRFYMQQKNAPKRRLLKKDYIEDIDVLLGEATTGLDKLTIANLEHLTKLIQDRINSERL